jgi:hypothetical protein
MPERRKFSRTKAVIPVKLVNGGNSQLIHTLDIGGSGARLGGLRSQLRIGEIIVLHRGVKNAKFRIMWIQQLSPNEIHAGVQVLENQNGLFGLEGSRQGSTMTAEMTL